MTGLIWKDFLVMRKAMYSWLLVIVCYVLLAYLGTLNFGFITSFTNLLLMVMPLSSFALDEQAKWDRYAMSLPLGRRAVVGARYLFLLALFLIAMLLGLAGSAAAWLLYQKELGELVLTLLASAAAALLISAVLVPISYKLGVERARIALYAILLIPFLAILLLYTTGILDLSPLNALDSLSPAALAGWVALLLLGGLGAVLASYLVSCRIAAAKEY